MNILILSISLSLDAFSVSICKGLSIKRINKKDILKVGLYFGLFQAIMPLIGYFLYEIPDKEFIPYVYYSKFNSIGWYGFIMSFIFLAFPFIIIILIHIIFLYI